MKLSNIINTNLNDDIFALEHEYKDAVAETNIVILQLTGIKL